MQQQDVGGSKQAIAQLQQELEELRTAASGSVAEVQPQLAAATAISQICDATKQAFTKLHESGSGSDANGPKNDVLLSNLGSAISFFRDEFDGDALAKPLARVGLSPYQAAHHISDMYQYAKSHFRCLSPCCLLHAPARSCLFVEFRNPRHHSHRAFRGTYTKTLQPSGSGEVAARAAVGLPALDDSAGDEDDEWVEVDECLVWSPTGKGCIHWASEMADGRQRRFEKVQMEGTRDPRRGGSGTTR